MKFQKVCALLSAFSLFSTCAGMPVHADGWYDDVFINMLGDVNGDFIINSKDAVSVLMAVSDLNTGLTLDDESIVPQDNELLGNVNGDESINAQDAAMILSACANFGVGLPAEENFLSNHADVDGDGNITALDASYVLAYAASMGAGIATGTLDEFVVSFKPYESPTGSEVNIAIEQVSLTLDELKQYNYQVPVFIELEENPNITSMEFGIQADKSLQYEVITRFTNDLAGRFQIPFSFFPGMTSMQKDNFSWLTWADYSTYTEENNIALLLVKVPETDSAGDTFNIQFQYEGLLHDGVASNAMFALAKAAVYDIQATDGYIHIEGDKEELPAFKAGDADGSGEVDILDVITVNKSILGKELMTEAQIKAVDFNSNGKPDSSESLMILKYIVGLITDFNA